MSNYSESDFSALPQLVFPLVFSSYGLFLAYQNITRLQQYEETSEKAAEWSNTAAHRLHKTRTTQTTGTLGLILSFASPLALLVASSTYRDTPKVIATTALLNAALLYSAKQHMANFWNDSVQTRVPFVEKFNEAIRGSEHVVEILGALALTWAYTGIWAAIMEYSTVRGGNLLYVLVVGMGLMQTKFGKFMMKN